MRLGKRRSNDRADAFGQNPTSAPSNATLSRIAEDVGCHTGTAFSRAFRREYGSPPATWRRNQRRRAEALSSAQWLRIRVLNRAID